MILSIEGKRIGYEDREIIENINIIIDKPGLYKLEGSNGLGKSTFFKALNGELDWIKEGNIIVNLKGNQINIFKNRDIFFINDNFEGYLFLKPIEYIIFLSKLYDKKVVKSEILKYFDDLNFTSYIDVLIKNLSQGNKQKLVFISSILINCPIILFDEAFEHIDKKTMNYIKVYITEILKDKFIFLTSHTNILDDLVREIVYLENKQIVFN